LAPSWLSLPGVKGGGNYNQLKRGELLGGQPLWLHGAGEGGGDVHGAAAREEEEAVLGRRGEEEEGRVGYMG
jgi:hypothetical protein